jgi:DNA-binding NarL/FixJ family response regulator
VIKVATHAPDLVMLDLGMEGGGLDALRRIKASHPETFCVILTSSDDPLKAMAALSLGAEGYILKGIKAEDLLPALEGILARKTYVSPDFAMKLVSAVNLQSQVAAQRSSLSHREEQVMAEVQHGLTNREVAVRLRLSEQTVKVYMSSAMQKLGARNRVSAVQEYQRQMKDTGQRQKSF